MILSNFIICALLWLLSTINYYMTIYLVNKVEKEFICATVSVSSEMVAYFASGYLMEFFGPKKTYIGSFTLALIGGVLLLSYGLEH